MGYELYRRTTTVPATLPAGDIGTQEYAERYLDVEGVWQRSGTTLAIILQAVEGVGGIYVADEGRRPDRSFERDPAGRIAAQAFNSNDGWWIPPGQAAYLADKVDEVLTHGSVEYLQIDMDAWDGIDPNPPRVPVAIDISDGSEMRGAFESFRDFCRSSAQHGFEVW